jgi:hypothetical protein
MNPTNEATRDYAALTTEQRDAVRWQARREAEKAMRRYANLAATEAGIGARCIYPTLTKLAFTVGDDGEGGLCISLVTAYGPAAEVLWNQDSDDEWPDESEVTDMLEAAYDWAAGGCFERFQHLLCLNI